ncbi:MAG: GNAT family N-acetyltransferase [Chitinophagaceae bacterium]
MQLRQAILTDIPQLTVLRLSVTENQLSDPGLVTEQDYITYLSQRGRGWVCETGGLVTGFAIVDNTDHNVWALFVLPGYEGQGIGRRLHDAMLDWYFSQGETFIWLGTAPGTRAERFYRKAGWQDRGLRPNGEKRFELTAAQWQAARHHADHPQDS